MPRYYVYFDQAKGQARTSTKKPNTFPFIYVGEGFFTFVPSKGVQARCRSIEELEYFLFAHELQAVDEQRQKAFRALRERLEAMKTLREVRQHG